jgi:hypothetical protein
MLKFLEPKILKLSFKLMQQCYNRLRLKKKPSDFSVFLQEYGKIYNSLQQKS